MDESYRNTLLEVADSLESTLQHISFMEKVLRGENLDAVERASVSCEADAVEECCPEVANELQRAVNYINDEWCSVAGNRGRRREVRDFLTVFDKFCTEVGSFDNLCEGREDGAAALFGDFEVSKEYIIIVAEYLGKMRPIENELSALDSDCKKDSPLQGITEEMAGYFTGLTDADLEDALLRGICLGRKGDWTEHVNKATYFGQHFGVPAELMNRLFRFKGEKGLPTKVHYTRHPYPLGRKNDRLVEILSKYPKRGL